MNYKDILRIKPWLKLVNVGNISDRLLKSTNGNAFVVFNLIHCEYQIHTIQAERLSGDSYNANIPIEVLNQWIIDDYNSNDFQKYVDDAISAQQKSEYLNSDVVSSNRRNLQLRGQLETIERVMGTKI